ncbi:hypothetical protein SAMN05216186_102220 [Pseudomonas indica]|uniref:Uncharacterized protein n=1 Tax=Pseudomonas indica TaxID=137658 RepID=A0A1G8VG64_9PSED|nr:hypothetical protein SAMN05216186_102220 [Pseudomonas indica]
MNLSRFIPLLVPVLGLVAAVSLPFVMSLQG